jgi:hypothetical protein
VQTGYSYGIGSTLPTMAFRWLDRTGAAYDFSTGWTFVARVAALADPYNVLTTASTITVTGSASTGVNDTNIDVTMSVTNVTQILAAYETEYTTTVTEPVAMVIVVTATRTSDSLPMVFAEGDLPVWQLMPTRA